MIRFRDKEAERLFRILDEKGLVAWPEDSADPVVLVDELHAILRRRGQREIRPGRIRGIIFGHNQHEMKIWEGTAIANALSIDVSLLHYDVPPKRGQKPKSLIEELNG
jgi:hypothetical protein